MGFAQEMRDFSAGMASAQNFWDKRSQAKYWDARARAYDRQNLPPSEASLAGAPGFQKGTGSGVDEPPGGSGGSKGGGKYYDAIPPADAQIGAARHAISDQESGSNYGSVGIEVKGDHAYGKYQVMGNNIPGWTEKYYGKRLTPEEFLKNPEAQDKVFDGEFYRLADRYGWEGAAQAWLGGEGSVGQANKADPLGTSVGKYGKEFLSGFNKYLKAGGGDTSTAAAGGGGAAKPAPATSSGAVAEPTPADQSADGTDENGYIVKDGKRYNDAGETVDESGQPVDASDPAADAQPVDTSDSGEGKAAAATQEVASIEKPVIPMASPEQFGGGSPAPAQAPSPPSAGSSSQPNQQPQTQVASAAPSPRSSTLGTSKVADRALYDDALARQQYDLAMQQYQQSVQGGGMYPTQGQQAQPGGPFPPRQAFAATGGVIPEYADGGIVDANNDGVPDYLQPENQDIDYTTTGSTQPRDISADAANRADAIAARNRRAGYIPNQTKDDVLTQPPPMTAAQRASQSFGRPGGRDNQPPPQPVRRDISADAANLADQRAAAGRRAAGIPNRTKDDTTPDAVLPQQGPPAPALPIPALAGKTPDYDPTPNQPAPADDYDPMRAWSRGNANQQTVQKPAETPRGPYRPQPDETASNAQGNDLTNAGGVDPTSGEPLPDLKPRQPAPGSSPVIPPDATPVANPPVPQDKPVQNAPIPAQRPTVPTPTPRPTPPSPARTGGVAHTQHKAPTGARAHDVRPRQPAAVPPNPWSSESDRVYHHTAPVGGRYYEEGGIIPHYADGGAVVDPPNQPAPDNGHTGLRWFWDQLFEPAPSQAPAPDTQATDWRTGEQTTAHYQEGTPYQNVMPNVPLPPDKKPAQAAPLAKPVPHPTPRPTPPAAQAAPVRARPVLPVINESDRVYHDVAPDRAGQYTDVINARGYHAGPQRRAIFQQASGGVVPTDDDQRRMLNAGSQSPRIYEGSTAQQVQQSRPAQPQYTDDSDNAPMQAPPQQAQQPAPQQPQAAPSDDTGPQLTYTSDPGHASPAKIGVAQVGIHHGLAFLSHIFGFDQSGALPDPAQAASQKAGVRRFMDGEGAATPKDNATIDAQAGVNPDQSDAGKYIDRLARLTQVYLANGKKKEAGAAAASQLQYAATQFGHLGALAGASYASYLQTGDPEELKHTLAFMSKAHEYVPDGATFGVYVDPQTHQINATRTDADGNEEHYAIKPSELPGIISGIQDKSSYWQQIRELADPAGARAAAQRADADRKFNITQAGTNRRFNENQAGINTRFETGRQDRKEAAAQRTEAAQGKIPNWDQISPVMNTAQQTYADWQKNKDDPELTRKKDEAASALQDAIPNSYQYKTKFLQDTDGIAPMGTYTYIPKDQRAGAPAPATAPQGAGAAPNTSGTPASPAAAPAAAAAPATRKPPAKPPNIPVNSFYDFSSGNWLTNQGGKMVVVG